MSMFYATSVSMVEYSYSHSSSSSESKVVCIVNGCIVEACGGVNRASTKGIDRFVCAAIMDDDSGKNEFCLDCRKASRSTRVFANILGVRLQMCSFASVYACVSEDELENNLSFCLRLKILDVTSRSANYKTTGSLI
jgi:hypothetical protein